MTFEDHIRREHNMWHYLYFIVLIKVKDPTEFTGPESYVHDMVKVCTGWTVNDVAFLCMISFGTILALMPSHHAQKNSNIDRTQRFVP